MKQNVNNLKLFVGIQLGVGFPTSQLPLPSGARFSLSSGSVSDFLFELDSVFIRVQIWNTICWRCFLLDFLGVSAPLVISRLTRCRLTACLELNILQSMTRNNRRSTNQCRISLYHSPPTLKGGGENIKYKLHVSDKTNSKHCCFPQNNEHLSSLDVKMCLTQ